MSVLRSLVSPVTIRRVLIGSLAAVALAAGVLWLLGLPADLLTTASPSGAGKGDPEAAGPAASDTEGGEPLSAAERIARLQRSLEMDRKYLDTLNAQLKDPRGEYYRADAHFQPLDAALEQARSDLRQLRAAGKQAETAAKEAAVGQLETRWQSARKRFDLAIQERRTLQKTIAALTRKIQEDQQTLDRLTGAAAPPPAPAAAAPPAPAPAPKAAQSAPSQPPGSPAAPTAVTAAALPQPALPAAAGPDGAPQELVRAREEAKAKEEAARRAEDRAQSITERLASLRTNIRLAKKLLDTARGQADQAQAARAALDAELQKKLAAHAPEAEIKAASERVARAQQRLEGALAEARSTTDRLHELQSELSDLQAEQIAALHDADARKQAAEAAENRVATLQNPFRPHNILQWLLHHGPRLLLVLVGMLALHRLSRLFSRRIAKVIARGGGGKRGTRQDRENRASTLVGVFSNTASLLILGGGTLMGLDELGIPIVPLMGGAAVIGLAVAFGAQNLIKDYFSGFMVLLEDQYAINDVVQIGSVSGQVEHISLRMTVLRDLEGVVHFIPHGTITTVSNMTHGWSRALFAVGVAYKENVDHVMGVLMDLGHEMRGDPAFGPLILEDPEMLGVDELADSAVVIKFFLKTAPLRQWAVKRELLRRIKIRFAELGIEIPYPQQTVTHRYEEGQPAPAVRRGAA